jgi:LysR family transcriptional activator of nhaA
VEEQFGAVPVGDLQLREQFYVISNERKIKHPAVEAILSEVHAKVFTK